MGTNCASNCSKVKGGFENDIDAAKKQRRKQSKIRKSIEGGMSYS